MVVDIAVNSLIEALQRRIDAAVAEHVTGASFALVDFPDHPNVGDSAIWLGEVDYFARRHGKRAAYVCRYRDFSAEQLEARCPDGTVFIHGGGNFGDIWGHHQKFREHLLGALRHRKIVQLPQSIQYSSDARRDQTARLIAEHPDFTLLVRDEKSLDFARRHFDCKTGLAPDMAFCIGRMPADEPSCDVLALLRTDVEKAELGAIGAGSIRVEDWLSERTAAIWTAKTTGPIDAALRLRPADWKEAMYAAAARHRVNRGRAQLSSARVIVTDRLHVHILSLLLGRPHAVLDNSYGKIARFMEAWTGESQLVYRADGIDAALDWAIDRAGRSQLDLAA